MKISARNVFSGTIVAMVKGPVTTEVTLEIGDGLQVVSTITTASADSLNLKPGGHAFGIVKSSNVMIGVDD
jgi:molybdate transport system regulatory protein